MTKDEVLKQRAQVFDSGVRVERARQLIEALNAQLAAAREDYSSAVAELGEQRRTADATEANAVKAATVETKAIEVSDEQASDQSRLRG